MALAEEQHLEVAVRVPGFLRLSPETSQPPGGGLYHEYRQSSQKSLGTVSRVPSETGYLFFF